MGNGTLLFGNRLTVHGVLRKVSFGAEMKKGMIQSVDISLIKGTSRVYFVTNIVLLQ
jgi:hypothetical protein